MATRKDWKQKGRELKNGLPDQVELVIGMKAMVMTNVDADLDVANGSHGEIVDIGLDPREEKRGDCVIVELGFPPTYILVKLYRTQAEQLEGLEAGVLPIELAKKSFKITVPVTGKKRVQRKIT
ncbi:hypothetical protein K439DRAFT_1616606 [Ramaria rubella]|nr:hypothetical protein K439DRAFT_1616606 [Ramaria rubella]